MIGKSDTILLGLVVAIDWCLLEQRNEYQLGIAANSKDSARESSAAAVAAQQEGSKLL